MLDRGRCRLLAGDACHDHRTCERPARVSSAEQRTALTAGFHSVALGGRPAGGWRLRRLSRRGSVGSRGGYPHDRGHPPWAFDERRLFHRVDALCADGSVLIAGPVWNFIPVDDHDLHADTWVATDALNRTLPTSLRYGPPRADRQTGIFYFLWHQPGGLGDDCPRDNTAYIESHGGYTDPTNPWRTTRRGWMAATGVPGTGVNPNLGSTHPTTNGSSGGTSLCSPPPVWM